MSEERVNEINSVKIKGESPEQANGEKRMSKHNDHRTHAGFGFPENNVQHQTGGSLKAQNRQDKKVLDDGDIEMRAYYIHCDKGGSALDNWLEAERILKYPSEAVS